MDFFDKLAQLAQTSPETLLLIILALSALAFLGTIVLITRVFNWAVALRARRSKAGDSQLEGPEEKSETDKLIDTVALLINTMAARDARIGNLADQSAKITTNIGAQTESITKLVGEMVAQRKAIDELREEMGGQKAKVTELIGRIGHSNQLSEDWQTKASEAQTAAGKAVDSVNENTKQLGKLKEQIARLEEGVREEVLPLLQAVQKKLDSLIEADQAETASINNLAKDIEQVRADLKTIVESQINTPPTVKSDDGTAIPLAPVPNIEVKTEPTGTVGRPKETNERDTPN